MNVEAKVIETGLLPCGHAAETEEDKIITDWCPVCGWRTPARKEADKLNEYASLRANAETRLIKFVKSGEYQSDETISGLRSGPLKSLCDEIFKLSKTEEVQREKVKITREEERTR